MKPKICVVTGTRAEYGLLKWVMKGIKENKGLNLQIIVTGMHLSPEFGLTFNEIEEDGFLINKKVEILTSSDTAVGITKSIGLGLIGFSEAFEELNPDIVMLLGDRFEIFAAASAALVACIPICHIHGGEKTEGAFDEAMRHSITKMSQFHFVAAEDYRKRVIQLGEQPERVFCVGGLGIDHISRIKLLSRDELEESLNFKFGKKNLLVTFHPVTLELNQTTKQINELLQALAELTDTHLILTMPNADTESRSIFKLMHEFQSQHEHAKVFTSLGQVRYLSCISHVDGVIGNSSSGLMEVPSFKKGTVNIGDRQRGRLQAESVINCIAKKEEIYNAINELYTPNFIEKVKNCVNPYGKPGASDKIIEKLTRIASTANTKKAFFDLEC